MSSLSLISGKTWVKSEIYRTLVEIAVSDMCRNLCEHSKPIHVSSIITQNAPGQRNCFFRLQHSPQASIIVAIVLLQETPRQAASFKWPDKALHPPHVFVRCVMTYTKLVIDISVAAPSPCRAFLFA